MAEFWCQWCQKYKPEAEIPAQVKPDANGKKQGRRRCLDCREKAKARKKSRIK